MSAESGCTCDPDVEHNGRHLQKVMSALKYHYDEVSAVHAIGLAVPFCPLYLLAPSFKPTGVVLKVVLKVS